MRCRQLAPACARIAFFWCRCLQVVQHQLISIDESILLCSGQVARSLSPADSALLMHSFDISQVGGGGGRSVQNTRWAFKGAVGLCSPSTLPGFAAHCASH